MSETQMHHSCRVIGSPWPGVFGTDADSARHYDRHWHSTYGIGFIERESGEKPDVDSICS